MTGSKVAASEPGARVWQACSACRRKKIKCDGKQPCRNCRTRDQTCEFPEAKDHASASRNYANSFESRCQDLDLACQRLQTLTGALSRVSEVLDRVASVAVSRDGEGGDDGGLSHEMVQAASVLQSFPGVGVRRSTTGTAAPTATVTSSGDVQGSLLATAAASEDESSNTGAGDVDDGPEEDDDDDDLVEQQQDDALESEDTDQDHAGALVTDSYGRLRFVGGATNRMLIDAAKGLSPNTATSMTSPTAPSGGGPSPHATFHDVHGTLPEKTTGVTPWGGNPSATTASAGSDVELPLFVRGQVWPELPFLPKPSQLQRPPQYVSDVLVGLYFAKIHPTFPVLFRPHFMLRYRRLLRSGGGEPSADPEFLRVFFAVCACSSGLLPSSTTGSRGGAAAGGGGSATAAASFPGLEHYEKALLLHYAGHGQASLENAQCLALLALCAASWNTLTQSWSLAGQAVRAAMDIGLHLGSQFMMSGIPASAPGNARAVHFLRQQIARRIWWSIFSLDRVVSICLGRPMAVHEKDCSCELPLDLDDEPLQRWCHEQGQLQAQTQQAAYPPPPPATMGATPTALTGFLAFAQLSHIAGRIQQLGSSRRFAVAEKRYPAQVAALDTKLRKWLDRLPDTIRFSANAVGREEDGGRGEFSSGDSGGMGAEDQSGLVMCVIIFMVHAGSLLNLYQRQAVRDVRTGNTKMGPVSDEATRQCISAARSCINAAELVRDLVPPSHYLAICVHCLTLSGVALLRMSSHPPDPQTVADAQRCISFLGELETRWSGAARSRAIVEQQLLAASKVPPPPPPPLLRPGASGGHKRNFSEFAVDDAVLHRPGDNDATFLDMDPAFWHSAPWSEVLTLHDPGGPADVGAFGSGFWG